MDRRRLAIVAFAALAGCHRAPVRTADPTGPVQVLSVTPAYRGDGGADFTVLLTVDNGEPEPGSVVSVSWRIWVQRRRFAEGEQRVGQLLSPRAATRLEVVLPLALRKAPLPADLAPVELSIRGDLTVLIAGVEQTLPFARTLIVEAPGSRYTGLDED